MSEEIRKKLEVILKDVDSSAEYREDVHLRKDLNMDSLDVISFLFEVEVQTGIKIPEEDIDAHELLVLGNLCNYIEKKSETSAQLII